MEGFQQMFASGMTAQEGWQSSFLSELFVRQHGDCSMGTPAFNVSVATPAQESEKPLRMTPPQQGFSWKSEIK